jgi:3-oxoacyl-[acyl-carrier-protein] synthase III
MAPAIQSVIAHEASSPSLCRDLSRVIGISAIATYQPPLALENDWFEGSLSRKFVQHTGIVSRRVSYEDEVSMGVRAAQSLREQTGCDLRNCVAVVFAGSSLLHRSVARRYLSPEDARCEDFGVVARLFVDRLGIPSVPAIGINWGCSGYAKAMQLAASWARRLERLRAEQFILIVTANRTSKIVDYGCKVTAPIFGDFAQATLVGGPDSRRYPFAFALLYATAERRPADGVFFDYHLRENVTVPTADGGRGVDPRRVVFSLNMMGLGDCAPRAMADAAAQAIQATGIHPEEVDFVVPHQAGKSVVDLAAMKLQQLGIRGEVVNGLTRNVGNISSSSVPYALEQNWRRLHGTIVCPTAAVGRPGSAAITQGCIILRSTKTSAAAPIAFMPNVVDWQLSNS